MWWYKFILVAFIYCWTSALTFIASFLVLRQCSKSCLDDDRMTTHMGAIVEYSRPIRIWLAGFQSAASGILCGLCFLGLLPTANEHFSIYLKSVYGTDEYSGLVTHVALIACFLVIWCADTLMHSILHWWEERKYISAQHGMVQILRGESSEIDDERQSICHTATEISNSPSIGNDVRATGRTSLKSNTSRDSDVIEKPTTGGANLFIRTGLLAVALGIHAFFEGLGIGLADSVYQTLILAVVTAMHEPLGLFSALTGLLSVKGCQLTTVARVIIPYSAVLPLGILTGIIIVHYTLSALALSICMSLAAGAIFFVVFIELLPPLMSSPVLKPPAVLLCFTVGFCILLGLQIWEETLEKADAKSSIPTASTSTVAP